MKKTFVTILMLIICACNVFAQYIVPNREPIRMNLDAFKYTTDKIDAKNKEALSYRTAICNEYADIISNYDLSEEAEKQITEIKEASIKRIDDMALYGSYSYSLDTAIKEYGTVIPQMRKIAREDMRNKTNGNEITQTTTISDIEYAHSFYKENRFDKAVEYYSKIDLSRLDDNYLIEYAMAELLQGNSQRSLNISLEGLRRNPRNAIMNRIAFYNCTDLKDFRNALKYADTLFQSDGVEITVLDYQYYGYALMGDNAYDKAIKMFKKALEINSELNDVHIQLSKAYAAKGEFIMSLAYYDEYLKKIKQPTTSDFDGLAQLYVQYASSINSLNKEKKDALNKADEIYKRIAISSPQYKFYATIWRARINSQLDPETIQGLAKPYYEEYVKIAQTEYADNPKLLIEPYLYLGHYYIVKKDNATAKTFYEKIIAIDPKNPTATFALEML